MTKCTTAYRVYTQGEYEDTETTLGTFWSLVEARAFKDEHNRYYKEWDVWIKKSFEHARENPEFKQKRSENQAIYKKLRSMNETDSEYAALEKRYHELSLLVSNMIDNLCNMWKASNPFQTTAAPQDGEAFIEILTIQ